jgi:hypothetical protein
MLRGEAHDLPALRQEDRIWEDDDHPRAGFRGRGESSVDLLRGTGFDPL